MKLVLPALARPLLEPHLPAGAEPLWFTTVEEAGAGIADAEVAWVDLQPSRLVADVLAQAGPSLRWLSTIYAGLDTFPLGMLRARGVTVTNGSGINAVTVAEYAVMMVLAAAKRFDTVVRLYDARDWSPDAPGKLELDGSRALVVGYGTIGRLIGTRLAAFGVEVTGVTRSGRDGTLAADAWKPRIGEYDWIILAAPSTGSTKALIGAAELDAMKPSAWIVNIARGDMIDQGALVAALTEGRIAGAMLDPTEPEPLPQDHPLWSSPNTLVTMHLSGRSQTTMFRRGAELFLANLTAWTAGAPMRNVVDLDEGY